MTDDIVARLRLYANASIDGGWASVFRSDLNIAADEIERLREQLRLANIDNFNTTAEVETLRAERDEANANAKLYRDERDAARRMVCGLDADIMEDQIEYARHRGWDCFKERDDARP